MLEPIKIKAIEAAVRTLTNLGCKLKVITVDGNEYGDLVAVAPKTKTVVNHFIQTGYREKVDALKIGEMLTMPCADPAAIENFRSALVSRCIRTHGKGSVTSDIDQAKGEVTILRQA